MNAIPFGLAEVNVLLARRDDGDDKAKVEAIVLVNCDGESCAQKEKSVV